MTQLLNVVHENRDIFSARLTIELRTTSSGGWLLLEDDAPITELRSEDSAIPAVKQLLRERAVGRHAFLLSVHAGAVAFGDACVLLPAAAGSGKTTLTMRGMHCSEPEKAAQVTPPKTAVTQEADLPGARGASHGRRQTAKSL